MRKSGSPLHQGTRLAFLQWVTGRDPPNLEVTDRHFISLGYGLRLDYGHVLEFC